MNKKRTAVPDFVLDEAALPASLRDFVRTLGLAGTLRLLATAQGGRIMVPKKPREDDPLRASLGEAAYTALVREYSRETLDIPKADAFMRTLRHSQVQFYREAGLTMDAIAVQTGYTKRWVVDILGGHADGKDVHTVDMFDVIGSPATPKLPAKARQLASSFGAHNPWGAA